MSENDANSAHELENEPTKRSIRKNPLFLLPLIVFSGLALLMGFWLVSGHDPQKLPSALINKEAPQFQLPMLVGAMKNGKQVPAFTSDDFAGKVTVVNVFASWCGPCRAEHPFIKKLGKDDRIQLAGLNYKDPPAKAVQFLQEMGNPYDLIGADKGRVGIDWGVYGVPETFIVDRAGMIRYKFVGPLNKTNYSQVFLPELEKIINAN
ncbi:DsbE family thiol:disulfide interchange protein [Polycladidibacter stylochi]|uniref:DsbE family thiol:disulfide interchange protein n=1 Tax=Polycladidibacter stylochi TaxID=1807766 RepID=UPI0008332BAA|nr:DsbE family thiol:disulfide interchange protein [Pseudovibrio stylochi]